MLFLLFIGLIIIIITITLSSSSFFFFFVALQIGVLNRPYARQCRAERMQIVYSMTPQHQNERFGAEELSNLPETKRGVLATWFQRAPTV